MKLDHVLQGQNGSTRMTLMILSNYVEGESWQVMTPELLARLLAPVKYVTSYLPDGG
jgi:hypothetical protein